MNFENMTIPELAAYLDKRGEGLSAEEEHSLRCDPRQGVRSLLERRLRRRKRNKQEISRLDNMLAEERALWEMGVDHVAGVDEAGRGPLAGPVVAAAVIMPREKVIHGLNDSKQLTALVREKLFDTIHDEALAVAVGLSPVEDIDRINIYEAAMQAMREAVRKLSLKPGALLVDGFPIRGLDLRQRAVKGGDALSHTIAAASVVAKVTRDRLMADLHRQYPAYGFDKNKGYATMEHREALNRRGPSPAHRRSFRLDYSSIGEDERDDLSTPPGGKRGRRSGLDLP